MPGTIATGSSLGGYRIISFIGRGGMGEVYLAHDERLDRRIALKIPAPELAAEDRFRERFLRETRLAASLEHPAMVPIYEVGEDAGRVFMAMRYVEGEDLGSLLERDGRLDLGRTLKILRPIAECLDATHELGLVHRDVKPGNVLVGSGDRAYLTDFGLTKRRGSASALTETGQLVGTLDYVAPEQIEGRDVDGRADQYSLACVAFEMLVGRPPFVRPNDVALLYAHVHADRPNVSDAVPVRSSIDAPIARAMARGSADRFDSCRALVLALEASATAEAIPTPRRRGGRVLAAAASVLVVLGALALLLARDPDRPPGGASPAKGSVPPDGALARIDPESGKVTLTVEGLPGHHQPGDSGFDLVVGEGGVWEQRGTLIVHVDPEDGELVEEILGGAEMDLGHRTLWFIGNGNDLDRVDPATDDPLRPVRLPTAAHPSGGQGPSDVAVDRRSVWVSTQVDEIMRVDPGTLEIDVTTVDASVDQIAAADGWVFAVNRLESVVIAFPSISGPSDRNEIDLGTVNVEEIAAGAGRLWVLDSTVGAVVPVDPEGRVLETIPVGSGATDIDVGLGSVWVSSQSGILRRIDPTTLVVSSFDVGAPMVQVAIDDDGDSVWLSVFDLGDPASTAPDPAG